jgi:chromosome condensin MukBEF complex kleisin-like MukF subunit
MKKRTRRIHTATSFHCKKHASLDSASQSVFDHSCFGQRLSDEAQCDVELDIANAMRHAPSPTWRTAATSSPNASSRNDR